MTYAQAIRELNKAAYAAIRAGSDTTKRRVHVVLWC